MTIDLVQAIIYIIFDDTLFFICNLFNRFNLDMILLEFLALYTSNTGYFCHHTLGQIILFASSILVDIYRIYDEKNLNLDWKHYLLLFLDWIIQDTILAYKKYLIDIKFISPFSICFLFSSINISLILILYFSFRYFDKYFICLEKTCFNIFTFDIDKYKNNYHLAFSLSLSIICDCIFFFFYYNIFTLFTTNHLIIPFYIYEMIITIKRAKKNKIEPIGWLMLSLTLFFMFFGLFIFLEIIELNFCNLSNNIKIKIAERAREPQIDKILSEKINEVEGGLFEEENEEGEGEGESEQSKLVEIFPGYLVEF